MFDVWKYLDKKHFRHYWSKDSVCEELRGVIVDDMFAKEEENGSWSSRIEKMNNEPSHISWVDTYERERVMSTLSVILEGGGKTIAEFGSGSGFMMAEIKSKFPDNIYFATDLMIDGLLQSNARNCNVAHVQCDFTNAPFNDDCLDLVFSLNVLEHIEEDEKAIAECYRVLDTGGYCLFVVPRGANLYDYFDEIFFHKRRYAKDELKDKCLRAGFTIVENFHYAWLCYPIFWFKKKLNRIIGKTLTEQEKYERTKTDINKAMASGFAIKLIHFEQYLSKFISPNYGVREFILCRKR